MICYYYPPLTDVGCKRSVAFAKYWKKAGWEPHVLSVRNPDKMYCSLGNDGSPAEVPVTYSYSLFNVYKFFGKLNGLLSRILGLFGVKLQHNYFYDIFCIPDIFIGWVIPAIISGYKIIKRERMDILYISCSPFSAGIIGYCIKKLTGIPFALDYRDPFGVELSDYGPCEGARFRKPIDHWIASAIIKSCDLFTVTAENTKRLYIMQLPSVKGKIHTVYNGFDRQLLADINEQEKHGKFTIIYVGNFYYNIEFDYFFEGLNLLKTENEINSDNFQFLFYGEIKDSLLDSINRHDVGDLVQVKAWIPYKEVLGEIKRAHLQLLRIIPPMISTKLFEGIALNIPFLATIPEGEVEEIIKTYSPDSCIVTVSDGVAVAQGIRQAIVRFQNVGFRNNKIEDFLTEFSRENTAYKMLELFLVKKDLICQK